MIFFILCCMLSYTIFLISSFMIAIRQGTILKNVQLLESWAASANQIAGNIIVTSKFILRLDNTKNTKESPNPTCTSNRQQH